MAQDFQISKAIEKFEKRIQKSSKNSKSKTRGDRKKTKLRAFATRAKNNTYCLFF